MKPVRFKVLEASPSTHSSVVQTFLDQADRHADAALKKSKEGFCKETIQQYLTAWQAFYIAEHHWLAGAHQSANVSNADFSKMGGPGEDVLRKLLNVTDRIKTNCVSIPGRFQPTTVPLRHFDVGGLGFTDDQHRDLERWSLKQIEREVNEAFHHIVVDGDCSIGLESLRRIWGYKGIVDLIADPLEERVQTVLKEFYARCVYGGRRKNVYKAPVIRGGPPVPVIKARLIKP